MSRILTAIRSVGVCRIADSMTRRRSADRRHILASSLDAAIAIRCPTAISPEAGRAVTVKQSD
jgi:hypothetical protein